MGWRGRVLRLEWVQVVEGIRARLRHRLGLSSGISLVLWERVFSMSKAFRSVHWGWVVHALFQVIYLLYIVHFRGTFIVCGYSKIPFSSSSWIFP